jgi:translocation and assembly module TamB
MMRILAIFLLLLTVLTAQAQERSARGFVEQLLENVLSAEGRSLAIDNASISISGDVTVGRVEVRDGADAWLVIESLSLEWRPLSLFSRQLEVTSLTAGRVHMLRMPATPEGGVAAPRELRNITAAVIRKLEIGTLQIDSPVLGQDATLELAGSGEITAEPVQILAEAAASRRDGKRGDLRLKVALDPRTRQVQAEVTFSEDSDGIVANLIGVRGSPSVDLALDAAGTYGEWKGSFSLDLDKERVFDGTATAASDSAGQRILVNGGGRMARVLPPSLEDLFGGVSELSASATLPAGSSTVRVDHVSLENEAFRFNLAGLADWEGVSTDLMAEIAARNAGARFELPGEGPLGKGSIAGFRASLGVTGSLMEPDWRVSLAVADFSSERLTLAPAGLRLEGRGLIATDAAPVTFGGTLEGNVGQGSLKTLPLALTGPLAGSVSGSWRVGGLLGITSAELSIGTSAAGATGTVDLSGGDYDLSVRVSAESPATGVPLLDRLLAGEATASARISRGNGGFSMRDVNLSSPAISFKSTGPVDQDASFISLAISLRDLGLLQEGMAGGANFDATIRSPWSSPEVAIDGTGENIRLLNNSLEARLLARLAFSGWRPQGDFSFSGVMEGRNLGLHGSLDTDGEGNTILRDLNASSGSARASGSLVWPASGQPTGTIAFSAPDLRDVGPLLLMELSGALDAAIDMSGAGASHQTSIRFDGTNIASPSFAAGKAEGSLEIASLFEEPQPAGTASFSKLRIGSLGFDTAVIKAEAEASGGYRATTSLKCGDLSADAEAIVTMKDGRTTYSLSSLSGRLRGIGFKAAAPVVLRQSKDGIFLEDAIFTVGKGSVKLAGSVSPRLDLRTSISALPLEAVEGLAGVPGLRGTLSGDAAVEGSIERPQGRYKLTAKGFSASVLREFGVRPLNVTADGTIAGQTVTATLKGDGGTDLSFTGNGSADLGASTMDARFEGRAGSRLFSERLAAAGLRAEGLLSFNLRISGPFARPAINGDLALDKGIIGDTSGRFTVRDARGRAEISGSSLRIVSLTGTTGRKGSASASGTISLEGGMDADLRVNIKDGIYTDGGFVTSRYDADLAIKGPLRSRPVVQGEVGLRDAKITLSELPRRAVKPDDVRHIRAPAPVRRQARELRRSADGDGTRLDIDLTLRALDSISVSGRGLNVVLTGNLRVFGQAGDIRAQGSFDMLRGRLALPARNLDFERGSLTFDRSFDPYIDFVAVSRRSDATITLAVTGKASEPAINVTSMPQMPQEEALARLIFGSSMLELSPIQIAQIASYVATVTGSEGGGILSGLQAAMGLELTVGTSEKDETLIGATKQINDRLSVGVEQTLESNSTRINIDLSATPDVKIRGSVDSDRSSRIGVFYEKDY